MNRPLEDSYRSQRSKFFEMKADRSVGEIRRMYHFFRDQCFALLYAAKQAVDVERALRQWPTAHIVDLRRVRSHSQAVMEAVAAFLDIPFSRSLVEPTFFGEAYAGHFHDRNLNVGRIVDADSPHPEPMPIERYFLDRLKRMAETGKRRESTGSFAGWWHALCDTVRILPARHSLFSWLIVVHVVAMSWHMWRLRRQDLSTAAYDAALVYRPPRGIKTRLMKRFARA
jgi:hypothetical protein